VNIVKDSRFSVDSGSFLRVSGTSEQMPPSPAKVDKLGRSYSTGKRKCSIARVWLKRGGGSILVNGKHLGEYFHNESLVKKVYSVFTVAGFETTAWDVMCFVKGGGLSGQAGAVLLGVSRALSIGAPGSRPSLKSAGFLTRDSRIVERKKYGHKKARKRFQFSKR
jgi:small subunit ribosomal protein S9